MAHDNHSIFADLVNKQLYYMPVGFNEGYDNKFTRNSQLYIIINMFLLDFFKKKIHNDNEVLLNLRKYMQLFLFSDPSDISLSKEKEIIEYLTGLDAVYDLKRVI